MQSRRLCEHSWSTLVKIVIAIVIAGIFLAMTVAVFYSIINKNRATFYADEFIMALNLARNVAAQETVPVSICPIDDQKNPNCNTDRWMYGWVVFLDVNDNGILQNEAARLLTHDALDKVLVKTDVTRITFFDIDELFFNDVAIYFQGTFCYGKNAKEVIISKVGKVKQNHALCR